MDDALGAGWDVVTFPSLLVLRKKMPDVPRPFRIPGGGGPRGL